MPIERRTLHEVANYPPHPPRTASALYTRNHHRLVYEEDRPCLVCGVRQSTLHDPAQNPYGATQLETHHRIVEWSLARAVDIAKFNHRIRPGLLRHTNDTATYGHEFTQEELITWVEGHADNLWVLCDLHHRHPLIGIHAITGPIWGIQDVLVDGYDLTGFTAESPVEAAQLTTLPLTTGVPSVPQGVEDASTFGQTSGH